MILTQKAVIYWAVVSCCTTFLPWLLNWHTDGATSRIPLPAILLLVWRHRCCVVFSCSHHPMEFSSLEPASASMDSPRKINVIFVRSRPWSVPVTLFFKEAHRRWWRSFGPSSINKRTMVSDTLSDVLKGVACHILILRRFPFIQKQLILLSI